MVLLKTNPEVFQRFDKYLSEKGLKSSKPRDKVVEIFARIQGHCTVDELVTEVKKEDPKIGQATVYRTIKLLTEANIALPTQFYDGQTRYEYVDINSTHHDHLICERCSKIVEFVNHDIERLQEEIASQMGFLLTDHSLELVGLCKDCQSN